MAVAALTECIKYLSPITFTDVVIGDYVERDLLCSAYRAIRY